MTHTDGLRCDSPILKRLREALSPDESGSQGVVIGLGMLMGNLGLC